MAALLRSIGPGELAKREGVTEAAIYQRRRAIEKRTGEPIVVPGPKAKPRRPFDRVPMPSLMEITIRDGHVIFGSDAHYWPGIITTAHRGLVQFCKTLKPVAVVLDGDIFDGAGISRFPADSVDEHRQTPPVVRELEASQERLGEIKKAAGKARRIKLPGNHDERFEKRLLSTAAQFDGVKGFALRDHFPDWEEAQNLIINGDVWVGHDFKGGPSAGRNNTLNAGMHAVTGHHHRGTVGPFTDLRGTRYGIDLPSLAEPWGPQFGYAKGRPRDQRSGFGVARFIDGEMLQPELAIVVDEGLIEYCNERYRV